MVPHDESLPLDRRDPKREPVGRWFNERHERKGHLFERRFSAKRIEDDEQLYNTAQYILQNPVKAGLCSNPFDWRWLGGKLLVAARPARAE